MKKELLFLASLSLFLFGCSNENANEELDDATLNSESPTDVDMTKAASEWDFPIKPGTAEWNAIADSRELINKSQVPENLLPAMTTEKLADLWYDYPYWATFTCYGTSLLDGTDRIIKDFNGAKELLKRKDNCQPIVAKLKTLIEQSAKNLELLQNRTEADTVAVGDNKMRMEYVVTMLSRDEVVNTANAEDLSTLFNVAYQELEHRTTEPEVHSTTVSFCYLSYLVGKAGAVIAPEKKAEVAELLAMTHFADFDMEWVDRVLKLFKDNVK